MSPTVCSSQGFAPQLFTVHQTGSTPQVVALPRIKALRILHVRVPIPVEVRELERVRLSFDVEVEFHAKIQSFNLPEPGSIKIGPEKTLAELLESLGPSDSPPLAAPLFGQPGDRDIVQVVRVEASS